MIKVRNVTSAILVLAACSATCIGQTSSATFRTPSYNDRLLHSPYTVDVNNNGILKLVQLQPPAAAVRSNSTIAFTPGLRNAVASAAEINNQLPKTAFASTAAGEACNPPSSAGVNICAPASGSTLNSPVQIEASAAVTGVIAHTQLWVDGVKKFTEHSTSLDTSIILPAGLHRFAVVATNTAGQKWKTAVYATVQ
jgi:hypothetical protein